MSLSVEEKALAVDFIAIILNVGVPAAIKAIKQIEISDDPTPDEISRLSDVLKRPESYFKCGGQT